MVHLEQKTETARQDSRQPRWNHLCYAYIFLKGIVRITETGVDAATQAVDWTFKQNQR